MICKPKKAFSLLAALAVLVTTPASYGVGVGLAQRKAKPQVQIQVPTETPPRVQTQILAKPKLPSEPKTQLQVQTQPQVQPKSESQRIGLWTQNGIQDSGHIEWVERSTCKPVTLKEPFFLVTDYWSSNDESNYETLRSSGLFKRDGSNIISYLPKGSLVSLLGSFTKEYERVFVISLADVAADANGPKLSAPRDQGFVHRKSLNDLTDYLITLSPSRSLETAKTQGMDLNGKSLKALQDVKEQYIAVNCAYGGTNVEYMLFHTDQEITGKEDLLGISKIYSKLLDTATAYPDENDGQEISEDDATAVESEKNKVVPSTGSTKAMETKSVKTKAVKAEAVENKPVDTKPTDTTIGGVPIIKGTAEEVVCMDGGQVTVREAAKKAGEVKDSSYFFITKSGTAVKRVQDFDGQTRSRKGTTYIKIEVVGKSAPNVGWVASQYVKNKSLCMNASSKTDTDSDTDVDAGGDDTEKPVVTSSSYIFPLMSRADLRYSRGDGARWWGAGRPGRKHAGCDLFRPTGNRVRTVGAGRIIRGPYPFYCRGKKKCKGKGPKSFAVEQQLNNGLVIRYGEIGYAGAIQAGNKGNVGKDVTVGKIGFPRMLHFELYSGKASPTLGLTDLKSKNGFQRRGDLMDPTQYLLKLESQTLGGAK